MRMTSHRFVKDARELILAHREKLLYVAGLLVALVVYGFSRARDEAVYVYHSQGSPDFKDARVLGSHSESMVDGREKLLSKAIRDLVAGQALLRESNEKLQAKIVSLEQAQGPSPISGPSPGPSTSPAESAENSVSLGGPDASRNALLGKDTLRLHESPEQLTLTQSSVSTWRPVGGARSRQRRRQVRDPHEGGPTIISFPVKDIPLEKTEGVVVPAGSYVKAKLMTGVEAPEGKTYPVLLQLDYAYIVPNRNRLDLSGCFMIAKSQGDLSTERVQMQATKLSCVSKEGRMFERDVNGFIADDKDNSFAVIGSVNSKQDRVAAMAFLSSIVEGVGKAVQQSQTTQQTTPLGGSQSVVTGNSMEYMAAGGAANAASMVTQWYLKQAQNLLPTINVGSGQDVWIVMQDTVKLPNDYFKKNAKNEMGSGSYMYFSRVLD